MIRSFALLACCLLAACPLFAEAEDPGALVVSAGSEAREDLVAVGRPIRVEGTALRDVATIGGDITIGGTVRGDVQTIGGSIRLLPGSRVDGDAVALLGVVQAEPGARVAGRMACFGPADYLEGLAQDFPRGYLRRFYAPASVGLKIGFLLAWFVFAPLLAWITPRALALASEHVGRRPLALAGIGLLGWIAVTLAAILFLLLVRLLLGVPLLVALVAFVFLSALFGVTAVLLRLGSWIAALFGREDLPAMARVAIGVAVYGVVRLLPFVALPAAVAAHAVGFGVVLATRFGTGKPWLPSRT